MAGQIIASSNEVTFNYGYLWEYTEMGLDAEFGTPVICADSAYVYIYIYIYRYSCQDLELS